MTRHLVALWRGVSRSPLRTLFSVLMLTIPVAAAQGQEFESEMHSSVDELSPVPCPPGFPAFWRESVFGTFVGYSHLTMVQSDETHTYSFSTYEFSGKTVDGKTSVRGTHHVNSLQCLDAAYAFFANAPALIGTLHNPVFKSLACRTPEEPTPGDGEFASLTSGCDSGGAAGGGGEEGGTLQCWTLQID